MWRELGGEVGGQTARVWSSKTELNVRSREYRIIDLAI